jgi:nucleoside-diphosphate-sugar epimerase
MVLKGHARIFSGEQWRPLVHVADVARALRKALGASADLVEGQIFNVGADEQNIQFKELAKPLMDINPNGYVAFEPATPDLRDYFVKFGKIKSVLGFEPSFSLAEGLADLGEWVKNGVPADPYSPKWRNS